MNYTGGPCTVEAVISLWLTPISSFGSWTQDDHHDNFPQYVTSPFCHYRNDLWMPKERRECLPPQRVGDDEPKSLSLLVEEKFNIVEMHSIKSIHHWRHRMLSLEYESECDLTMMGQSWYVLLCTIGHIACSRGVLKLQHAYPHYLQVTELFLNSWLPLCWSRNSRLLGMLVTLLTQRCGRVVANPAFYSQVSGFKYRQDITVQVLLFFLDLTSGQIGLVLCNFLPHPSFIIHYRFITRRHMSVILTTEVSLINQKEINK
jgi:hypothetical protein